MNKFVEELRDINLDIDELKKRKDEIKRKALEHRDTLTDSEAGEALSEAKKITAEIEALEERKKNLTLKIEEENRKEKPIMNENIENVNIRAAFGKFVLSKCTNRADAKLSDAEIRALGVANTTTSTTFSAPTAEADGVNNGGIFIPKQIMLDILRDKELDSPIFRDIITTAVDGQVTFPYLFSKSGAKKKAELTATENESVEWKILSGATGNYTDSIVVTFEQLAMSIDEFSNYLISIIGDSMRELLISDYIYGDGNSDSVKGLTVGAIDGSYATADKGDYRKIIEDAIKLLPAKKRAGAKIYLAPDIFDGMTFAKDDLGNYLLPVLNGGGLSKISSFPVEMDSNLSAGDFIVGNLGKYYKANINKPMTLGSDVLNQKRIITYTAHMMVTGVPVPGSIVYGTEAD